MAAHARDAAIDAHRLFAALSFLCITNDRKPVLRGDLSIELRDLIREVYDSQVLHRHIRPDQLHLLLSAQPPFGVLISRLQSTDEPSSPGEGLTDWVSRRCGRSADVRAPIRDHS
jgi:hypothetical protein